MGEEDPTTNGGMQTERSVGMYTRCIHVFARSAPICMLSRCLLKENSASELRRKFIKSALLVGKMKKLNKGIKLSASPIKVEREGGGSLMGFYC